MRSRCTLFLRINIYEPGRNDNLSLSRFEHLSRVRRIESIYLDVSFYMHIYSSLALLHFHCIYIRGIFLRAYITPTLFMPAVK